MTFGGVEALLIGWLGSQLPGNRFVTELPSGIATQIPVVQVVRIGGPSDDNDPSFQTATVSVDCFAADRIGATQLAQQVDTALHRLPGVTTAGATVTKVQTVSGASWRPFDDTTIRRFGASYALHVKAN